MAQTRLGKFRDTATRTFGALRRAVIGASVLGGAAIAGFAVKSIKNLLDTEKALRPLVERSRFLAESLQALAEVAVQAGSEDGLEAIVDTSQELQLQLGEIALTGKSRALPALESLGLEAEALQKLEPEAAWRAVVTEIQKIPNVADRAIAAEEIFGGSSEKLAGIVNLTNEEFAALEESVRDTANIYSTEALEGASELNGALDELKGGVDKLAAEFAVKLTPALTATIEFFNENEGAQRAVLVAVGLLAAALGVLAVQWVITTGIMLANPIGLVIIAIVALVAGIVLLIANWDTIWPAIKRTWETVSSAILGVWDTSWKWLKETFSQVIEGVKAKWDEIWGAIKTAWDTFTGAIGTVWDTTLALLFGETGLIMTAVGFVQAGWDVVWGLVKTAWDTFTGAIGTVWDTTLALLFGETGLIMTAVGFVQAGWDVVWGLVKTAWDTFTGAIGTAYDNSLGKLLGETGLIMTAVGFVQAGWDVVWGLVKTAWDTFTGAIGTVWDTTLALLFGETGLIMTAVGFVQAGWDVVWGLVKTAWDTFTGAIGTAYDNSLGKLLGETGLIMTAVGFVQAGWDVVWGLVKTAWDTFTGAIGTVWDTTLALLFGETGLIAVAIGFVQTKWDEIWGLVKTAWDTFVDVIQTAYDNSLGLLFGETGLIAVAIGFVQTKWDEIWGLVKTAWDTFVDVIQTAYDNSLGKLLGEEGVIVKAVEGVKTVWDKVWGKMSDGFKHIINPIIRGINTLIRAWNRLQFDVPGFSKTILGQTFGFEGFSLGLTNINEIPELAQGGRITRSGSAIVGDEGPEVVNLPRGAAVVPLGAGGGGNTYVFNFPNYVGSRDDLKRMMNETRLEFERRGN